MQNKERNVKSSKNQFGQHRRMLLWTDAFSQATNYLIFTLILIWLIMDRFASLPTYQLVIFYIVAVYSICMFLLFTLFMFTPVKLSRFRAFLEHPSPPVSKFKNTIWFIFPWALWFTIFIVYLIGLIQGVNQMQENIRIVVLLIGAIWLIVIPLASEIKVLFIDEKSSSIFRHLKPATYCWNIKLTSKIFVNSIKSWMRMCWNAIKNQGESVGIPFIIIGTILLLFLLISGVYRLNTDWSFLFGVSLGLISVGLGFIAIGMSAKLEKRVIKAIDLFNPQIDSVEAPITQILTAKPVELKTRVVTAKVEVGEPKFEIGSKEEAQQRLDKDTKKVGYVRGEIGRTKDGTWGIHWGGKYPL